MKIGIDISQLAYPNTGVANYLYHLVDSLLSMDQENEYVLFFSSMRGKLGSDYQSLLQYPNVTQKFYKFPPSALEFVWNRMHIFPIQLFIGKVDVFISSDWAQPPSSAKNISIVYDMIVYKFPKETHDQVRFSLKNLKLSQNIVASQKRRLSWVRKECDAVIAISEATKKDVITFLHFPSEKIKVVYPGI